VLKITKRSGLRNKMGSRKEERKEVQAAAQHKQAQLWHNGG